MQLFAQEGRHIARVCYDKGQEKEQHGKKSKEAGTQVKLQILHCITYPWHKSHASYASTNL
jgi:hypothetical protein